MLDSGHPSGSLSERERDLPLLRDRHVLSKEEVQRFERKKDKPASERVSRRRGALVARAESSVCSTRARGRTCPGSAGRPAPPEDSPPSCKGERKGRTTRRRETCNLRSVLLQLGVVGERRRNVKVAVAPPVGKLRGPPARVARPVQPVHAPHRSHLVALLSHRSLRFRVSLLPSPSTPLHCPLPAAGSSSQSAVCHTDSHSAVLCAVLGSAAPRRSWTPEHPRSAFFFPIPGWLLQVFLVPTMLHAARAATLLAACGAALLIACSEARPAAASACANSIFDTRASFAFPDVRELCAAPPRRTRTAASAGPSAANRAAVRRNPLKQLRAYFESVEAAEVSWKYWMPAPAVNPGASWTSSSSTSAQWTERFQPRWSPAST